MDIFLQTSAAINDETRVKILHFIYQNDEVCVCDIEKDFKMIQSRISRHLKILKDARFLNVDRRGRRAYYSIRTPLDNFRISILEEISHLKLKPALLSKEHPKKECNVAR
jgi:ArsR family transcriptional regulator